MILPVDVTKVELHQQYLDSVIHHFGTVRGLIIYITFINGFDITVFVSYFQLDVLINNAGRSQRALWQNIEIQLDRELFESNVFGLLNLSRVVLPHFLAKKTGQIAVMSSVCGKVGAPCSATYNATKHALHVSLFCNKIYSLWHTDKGFVGRVTLKHSDQSSVQKALQSPCSVPDQCSQIFSAPVPLIKPAK